MNLALRISFMATLGSILAVSSQAVPVTFNFSGTITTASAIIPVGTPFVGQYTYDPAAPGAGTYPQPTGSFKFIVGTGGLIGSLTSTTGNSITVGNNVPCCIGGFAQDFFSYSATNGTSSGFGGAAVIWAGTSINFSNGVFGNPGPLTDNSLTGVPNTLAAWGAGNMQIFIQNVFPIPFVGTTTAIGTITSIQAGALATSNDLPFQISYASNLVAGDSYVDLTNSGATMNAAGTASQNICVNVYTYDPSEELVSCCACQVTPNGLASLSVKQDLVSNTLTPGVPGSVVIKLISTTVPAGGTCNASLPTIATAAVGMLAWDTTLTQNTSTGTFETNRVPFSAATLSAAELARATTFCGFIQANGSGFGICRSCRIGALGGAQQ